QRFGHPVKLIILEDQPAALLLELDKCLDFFIEVVVLPGRVIIIILAVMTASGLLIRISTESDASREAVRSLRTAQIVLRHPPLCRGLDHPPLSSRRRPGWPAGNDLQTGSPHWRAAGRAGDADRRAMAAG